MRSWDFGESTETSKIVESEGVQPIFVICVPLLVIKREACH